MLRPAARETLVTFALALLVATALGSVLGIVVGVFRKVDRALGPTLEFARAMPPSAMVPIAALLIGYDETMKVAVVTFAAIWPVLLNARAGVRGSGPGPARYGAIASPRLVRHRSQVHRAGADAGHPAGRAGGRADVAGDHPAGGDPDKGRRPRSGSSPSASATTCRRRCSASFWSPACSASC